MFNIRSLCFALSLCSLVACAAENEPTLEARADALSVTRDLSRGRRRTLVEGIVAAENQLFTSTGRLFVSGDEGAFEIVRDGATYRSVKLAGDAPCPVLGLTEYAGTLYANCSDTTTSRILAAKLVDAPVLRVIHELRGVALANGLTSDDAGNLYVASTLDGTIVRLQLDPADPLVVRDQAILVPNSGLFTNGLKFFDDQLYWTAFTTVKTVRIRPDGRAGLQRDLGSAITFFDDLYVDERGILLDDYLNGTVVALDARGQFQSHTANATFEAPSSVQPAEGRLGLPESALVVTEKTGNRVSVYELDPR